LHAILSKALGDAERKGLVARNVARLASPPKSSATRAPEQMTWTPDELRSFLELIKDHRYWPLMRVAAMTGLRRSELCGLRWADVDLDAALATVGQSVQLVGGRIVVGEVKTTRSRRRLDLDAGTVAVLRAHRRAQAAERLMVGAGWGDRGLVFAAPDGRPLNPDTITQWFARTVRRSGLPPGSGCMICATPTPPTSWPPAWASRSSRSGLATRRWRSHSTSTGT
jgi:integrase